jgi:2-C-methyl-D-erythritol 2,4-cyclodiphosphate synthase
MRVGFGYDVHAFALDRPLVLGGVQIPHPKGLHGHSDADVLLHAICDALLGAIADGDIGIHFPDTDPQYRGIQSILLLKRVSARVREKGFRIGNIDATIVCQKPRLARVIPRMREEISGAIDLETERINIKATTTEGLGFAGREEGIAAYAVALVEESPKPPRSAKRGEAPLESPRPAKRGEGQGEGNQDRTEQK